MRTATVTETGRPRDPDKRESAYLMTVAEVAAETQMTKRWWYERIQRGHINVVRLGRHVRIRRAELDRYLAEHSTGG